MPQRRLQSSSILEHFADLRDPREGWRVPHPLSEILLVVPCATLCGMDDVVGIKLWGEARLELLRRFLPFERGAPSHDTLNDVMNGIDVDLFKVCFAEWMETPRDGLPENMAVIRHCAMNLVRATDDKHSLKVRRKKANLEPPTSKSFSPTPARQPEAISLTDGRVSCMDIPCGAGGK